MADAVDQLLSQLQNPATAAYRRVSDGVLQRRGAGTYTTPLVPGFEESMAENVLMVPPKETYDAQIEAGVTPHYVWRNPLADTKHDILQARRMSKFLAKVGTLLGADSAEPLATTGTRVDGYTQNRVADAEQKGAVARTWAAHGNLGETSDSAEPAMTNNTLSRVP